MNWTIIKDINDLIALILLVLVIPGMWIADSMAVLDLNGEVRGATIMGWTLILQYYFRKKLKEKGDNGAPK